MGRSALSGEGSANDLPVLLAREAAAARELIVQDMVGRGRERALLPVRFRFVRNGAEVLTADVAGNPGESGHGG